MELQDNELELEQKNVFELAVNETAKQHLRTSAKWEKFNAWVFIIFCALAVIGSVFTAMSRVFSRSSNEYYSSSSLGYYNYIFIMYTIIYTIIMVPNFYRLKFANKCLQALGTNDELLLEESFKNLKVYSVFWGILTIVGIAIMLIAIISMIFVFSRL